MGKREYGKDEVAAMQYRKPKKITAYDVGAGKKVTVTPEKLVEIAPGTFAWQGVSKVSGNNVYTIVGHKPIPEKQTVHHTTTTTCRHCGVMRMDHNNKGHAFEASYDENGFHPDSIEALSKRMRMDKFGMYVTDANGKHFQHPVYHHESDSVTYDFPDDVPEKLKVKIKNVLRTRFHQRLQSVSILEKKKSSLEKEIHEDKKYIEDGLPPDDLEELRKNMERKKREIDKLSGEIKAMKSTLVN